MYSTSATAKCDLMGLEFFVGIPISVSDFITHIKVIYNNIIYDSMLNIIVRILDDGVLENLCVSKINRFRKLIYATLY